MKQIIFLIMVLTACIGMGCSSAKSGSDNALVKEERNEGWKLLFDGKTMNGWRTYQNKPSDSWSVRDGALYCAGSTTNKSDRRADLITTGQYENFDLSLDWKISPKGNSGIMYLVTEEFPTAYLSGPEYQVIDDLHFPEKLEDWQKTGANYAMDPAPAAAPNPVGEWNHTRIVVNKGHVEHWLNGKKIVEYQLGTEEWKRKKAEGKWKDAPGYGQARKGYIALQDHGSEAWFKNIKIKEL
jgi:hypothetical protein